MHAALLMCACINNILSQRHGGTLFCNIGVACTAGVHRCTLARAAHKFTRDLMAMSKAPNESVHRTISPNHPIAAGVRIGHVHLKVANIERALGFYCGVLEFELMV
jgi:hypothetical protein